MGPMNLIHQTEHRSQVSLKHQKTVYAKNTVHVLFHVYDMSVWHFYMTIGDYYKTNSMNTSSGQAATRFGTVLDFLGKLGDPTVRQFPRNKVPLRKTWRFSCSICDLFMGCFGPTFGGFSNLDWKKQRGIMVSICTSIPLLVYSGHYYVDI